MKFRPHRFGFMWALVLAIPFYFLWNYLAPIYGAQLPPVYQHLPFWHCEGIFLLLAILRTVLLPW